MEKLKKKKILVFYPKGATAHYGRSIIKELIRRECIVSSYDERPSQFPIVKILTRILKKRVPQFFTKYINRIVKKHKHDNFDYILILRGEAFTSSSVGALRLAYPNATFILYLWDILATNDLTEIFGLFDRILTFDPEDANQSKDNRLIFRPTFYLDEFEFLNEKRFESEIDVFFVGTLRPERYTLLRRIEASLNQQKNSLKFHYYVPSFLVYFRDKYLNELYPKLSEISFKAMSIDGILNSVQRSKCILDLRYKAQVSLSMRAFEAMAARKKYITNNPNVKNYDFYDENNILVIDDLNPKIPQSFIKSDFRDVPVHIFHKYSVKSWVDDVFNV